jgi:hypothetical protein
MGGRQFCNENQKCKIKDREHCMSIGRKVNWKFAKNANRSEKNGKCWVWLEVILAQICTKGEIE